METEQGRKGACAVEAGVSLGSNLGDRAANLREAVRLLAALADSVAAGCEDFASAPDATAALREACEKLEAKGRELAAEAARIQKGAPFTYKEFLADEEAVSERQNELKMDIAELKAKIAKCEEEWNNG